MGFFLLDQGAHIGAMLGATFALPHQLLRPLRNFALPDRAVLVAALLVLSAFGGTIILHLLKRTIWPSLSQGVERGWREWAGVIERGAIVGLILLNLWFLVPAVVVGKGAFLYLRARGKGGGLPKIPFFVDLLGSATLAVILGWLALTLPVGG